MLIRILSLLPLLAVCQVTASAAPIAQTRTPVKSVLNPSERAKPWIDDALQIDSLEKRAAAIETIRKAIASSDEEEAHAGLIALSLVQDVEFDKASFREPVLPWLKAKDERVRLRALYALWAAGKKDGDLERALSVADGMQTEARFQMVHLLAMFSGNDLSGDASKAVEKLLATRKDGELRQALSGLWGTKVSAPIEARLLEIANGRDPEMTHQAIYFGLSTLQDKSEAVVDRLVAALADRNPENCARALWGLGQGVVPALEPKVADAMLKLYGARSDERTRSDALTLIGRYGVERHADALEVLAKKAGIAEHERTTVLAAALKIRERAKTR